jgi:hypothetical protein
MVDSDEGEEGEGEELRSAKLFQNEVREGTRRSPRLAAKG